MKEIAEDRVRSQNECMGDLSVNVSLLKAKIMLKSHFIKSNHRVLRENKVDT
jgi:hypothetical protein